MQRWLAYTAGAFLLAWTGGLVEVRADIEILYLEPTTSSPVLSTISTESEDFRRSEVVAGTGGWRRVARTDSYSGFIREEALDAEGEVRPGTAVYLTPSTNAAELTEVAAGDEVRVNFVDDWTEISIRKSIPGFVRPSAPPPTEGFLPPFMEEAEPAVAAEEAAPEPAPAATEPGPEAVPDDTETVAVDSLEAGTPEGEERETTEIVSVLPAEEAAGPPADAAPVPPPAAPTSPEPPPAAPVEEVAAVEEVTVVEETVSTAEPPSPDPEPAPAAGDAAGIPARMEAAVVEEAATALPPEVPVRILPVDRSLPTRPAEAGASRAAPDRQPVPVRVERRVPAPPSDILRTFRGRLELNRSTLGIAREFRLQLVDSRGRRIAFIDDSEVASASWIDRIGERVRVIGAASPSSGARRFVIRAVNIIPW